MMKLEWGYLWRTLVFHLLWVILSPLAYLISATRTRGLFGAWARMKLVYASVYQKFVIRPRLQQNLRNVSEEDLETLIWLSKNYPVSLQEAAEIWETNGRRLAMTIQQLQAMQPKRSPYQN